MPDTPWYFCQSVDLEGWLSCISTESGEGQNNDGEIICAFHPDWKPDEETVTFMMKAINSHNKLVNASEFALNVLNYLPGDGCRIEDGTSKDILKAMKMLKLALKD